MTIRIEIFLLSAVCLVGITPDTPHESVVSVNIIQEEGQVYVRVSNETADPLRYEPSGLRLDRHIRAGRWQVQPYSVVLGVDMYGYGKERFAVIAAGAEFSVPLSTYYRSLPPGRYRVCFRFWQGSLIQEHEQCSAPFILPP